MILFSYFTVEILVKNNCYSSLVVAAICLEFHEEDTSSNTVLTSSGLLVLWNFDQAAQNVAFIFLLPFLTDTFPLDYVSKLSGL